MPADDTTENILVAVRAQTRSRRPGISGTFDGRVKIRVAAPPVDGSANAELCRLLAREFGVPPSNVSLKRGRSSRDKTFVVLQPSLRPGWFREIASS